MIKEIVENKFRINMGLTLEEIVSYYGEEYREEILSRAKDIEVSLVEDAGVYTVGDTEIYVGEEPVCVKKENPHIIIPLSFMGDSHGNVVIVHLLLHAIGEESFVKDNKDAFNEIIVDYMANDIAKQLKDRGINFTVVSPEYESNSFYSKMFDEVKDFYEENKQNIIGSRMGKNVSFPENIDEYIEGAQSVVDSVFLNNEQTNFVIKRR